jgi:LacI family transcriptional regulator
MRGVSCRAAAGLFSAGESRLGRFLSLALFEGVEDYSRGQHHQVVYARFDYDAHIVLPTNDLPRILREDGGVEGVVLAGANCPSMVRYLEDLALPYVLFGNNLVNESAAYPKQNAVAFDEERVPRAMSSVQDALEAVEFLLELGHRRITFIGDLSMQWYRRRFEGYRAAMLARKLRAGGGGFTGARCGGIGPTGSP